MPPQAVTACNTWLAAQGLDDPTTAMLLLPNYSGQLLTAFLLFRQVRLEGTLACCACPLRCRPSDGCGCGIGYMLSSSVGGTMFGCPSDMSVSQDSGPRWDPRFLLLSVLDILGNTLCMLSVIDAGGMMFMLAYSLLTVLTASVHGTALPSEFPSLGRGHGQSAWVLQDCGLTVQRLPVKVVLRPVADVAAGAPTGCRSCLCREAATTGRSPLCGTGMWCAWCVVARQAVFKCLALGKNQGRGQCAGRGRPSKTLHTVAVTVPRSLVAHSSHILFRVGSPDWRMRDLLARCGFKRRRRHAAALALQSRRPVGSPARHHSRPHVQRVGRQCRRAQGVTGALRSLRSTVLPVVGALARIEEGVHAESAY